MKKILPFLVLSLLVVPVFVSAHGTSDFDSLESGVDMMQHMEDEILGEELHEEMEGLMIKMMQGEMTEEEANRMIEFMNDYPAPHGMMMMRTWNQNDSLMGQDFNRGMWGMHSQYSQGSFWGWLNVLGMLIWIIAGIFLILFVGKRLFKNKE